MSHPYGIFAICITICNFAERFALSVASCNADMVFIGVNYTDQKQKKIYVIVN